MPSRTPYQLFPAITTVDEAKGLVNYLTKNERQLLLCELQQFRDEDEDFNGLGFGLLLGKTVLTD